jgi:hypothetical protein
LTSASPGNNARPVWCRSPGARWRLTVHDVLFVLLTIGVFVLLALIVKGAEKL